MTETTYPLSWPDGWPRTSAASRSRGLQFMTSRGSAFSSGKTLPSFDRGRRDVIEELDRMKATGVTITTNVRVRGDGTPISNVNPNSLTMDNPGVSIYFMRKGRPFIMAQDAYDSVGVNLRSLALALDAMRAIERHGGGTMAAKAFDGFAALPPPAGSKPTRPWWEVLRYSANTEDREFLSVGEIEARYRSLAKKLHPDAGGSSEEMSELTQAKEEAITEIGASDE